MGYYCPHHVKPYFDTIDTSVPTTKEINEHRLYQCKDCKRWFSFLEHTKHNESPERNGERNKLKMGYWHNMYGYQNTDFVKGVIAGIEAYVVWKNGEQRVGSMETPLTEILEEVRRDLLCDHEKVGAEIEMKKPIQKEAWAAIRLDKDSGREWLDRNSVGLNKLETMEKTGSINHAIPYWAADNPVVRIVEVMIKEKMSDEQKNEDDD